MYIIMERLYQVTTSYFCCGVIVSDDNPEERPIVTATAPIMYWAVGKSWGDVRRWILGKKGKIQLVGNDKEQ